MPPTQQSSSELLTSLVSVVLFVLLLFFLVLSLAIKYRRRKREAEQMQAAYMEELRRAQLEIQEQTFTAISQEIHDNVGQTLSLAKVQVNIINQSETTDKALLADVRENIGKALADLRDLAKGLNSDHIQLVELKDLILPELRRLERSQIVQTQLTEQGQSQPVAHQKKLILFRMVQESLQNIVKHAEAQTVAVCLHYDSEGVAVSVADDGKGFDLQSVDKTAGLGLQNIVARATLIGGRADIKSTPGGGTTIHLTIPYA